MITPKAMIEVAERYNAAGNDQVTHEIVSTILHAAGIADHSENPENDVAAYLLGLTNDPNMPDSYIEVVRTVTHLIDLMKL